MRVESRGSSAAYLQPPPSLPQTPALVPKEYTEPPVMIERTRVASARVAGEPKKADPSLPPPAPPPPPPKPGFFARLGGIFTDISSMVVGTVIGAFQSLGKAGQHIAEGRIGQALKDVALIPFHAAALVVVKSASVVQAAIGVQGPPRELSQEEKELLRKVYGKSINVDVIRVVEGGSGLLTQTNDAITLGNTIHLAAGKKLTPDLLAHEVGHVWQYQQGGTDYMLKALWGQLIGEGYDTSKPLARGDDFAKWNPEQQAQLVQDLVRSGYFGPFATLPPGVTKEVAEAALASIRAGRGAGD